MPTIYDDITYKEPMVETNLVQNLLQSCLELVKNEREWKNFKKMVEWCAKATEVAKTQASTHAINQVAC